MEVQKVALVLADISGYTLFLRQYRTALVHAEEIITELLEAVIDSAEYPLTLNKLEGDAAFLYTCVTGDDAEVAKDVTRQVYRFFESFYQKQEELIHAGDGGCPCDACMNIHHLQLKAIVHQGEAVIKRIRQFEELAGEDVILIHRLLKNNLKERQYLMMTESFYELSGDPAGLQPHEHRERYDGFGEVTTVVFYPRLELPPLDIPETKRMSRLGGVMESMRLGMRHRLRSMRGSLPMFRHLHPPSQEG